MSTLEAYRDDGILATALLRRQVRLPTLPVTLVAVVAAAVGLVDPHLPTALAAFGVFVAAGLWSAMLRDDPRLGWLVPPALRVGEYAIVLWAAWHGRLDAVPAAFGLLAAIAFHHYDTVYRLRHQRVAPPTYVRFAGGGWEVRSLVLLAAAWLSALDTVVLALAIWCGLLFVSESLVSWITVARTEAREVSQSLEDDEEIF